MTTITERIERELGIPGLTSLLAERLEASDLQSLLLDVYRRVAKRRAPSALLSDYATNRFVRPSAIPHAQLLEWDQLAFSLLPRDCEAIELSPVAPLGTCSTMARLGQDWVLSTVRNTEVVSDSTNVLALEAAIRRRNLKHGDPRSARPVHLASSHRLLRTQHYKDPRLAAHFRVFSLCSAGRDRGGFQFETDALAYHVEFYLSAIRAFLGRSVALRVSVTVLEPAEALLPAVEQLLHRVRERFPGIDVVLDPERRAGREYYRSVCFWIYATGEGGEPAQLVDGGAVDWTQRLLSDVKERLVVSGVGSDRVCGMRTTSAPSV